MKWTSWAICTTHPCALQAGGGGLTLTAVPYVLGSLGTAQYNARIGITAEGSFTVTYLQDNIDSAGNTSSTSIYYRVYHESTDTAGPIVTDTTLVTTSGETADLNVSPTATVVNPVSYAVVSVSEALYDSLSKTGNAASNPANYVLYDSTGKVINAAISAVYFGFDEAANLAQMAVDNPTLYSQFSALSLTPSGRYEIVIALNSNGPAGGAIPLTTGTYTLTLLSPAASKSGITDLAGNRLNYTGYNTTGSNYSVKFSINVTSDSTSSKTGTETPGQPDHRRRANDDFHRHERAGDSASTSSVAGDAKGDFAVVWLQYASDGTTDVYMRLYNNVGNPLTNEILVNSYTAGNQTEASVAMDADGDFVVVWASEGQDPDGSWGIYGQRFNAVGREGRRRIPRQHASPATIRSRRPSPWTPRATSSSSGRRRVSRTATSTASRGKSSTAGATRSAANSPSTRRTFPAPD